MISSPATPTVCPEQKSENFQSHNVKPNLGCCSNIAITISYISVCCIISIIPRLTDLWPFKCQGHSVSLWCWPLTCNLEKCYSLRSCFGMYNLERQLWYLNSLTRHCPCNLLAEPTSPKHEYRWKLWGHPVTSSMTSSPWKNFSWHNLGRSFHIWGQIAAVLNISKFSKWPPFWARDKLFYRKLYRKMNIPFWAFHRRSSSNIDGDISLSKFDLLCDLVTSSMMSWKCICTNVVIISWHLCTGSLMMISLLVFQ